MTPEEAAKRIRRFVKARAEFHDRPRAAKFMTPDCIAAEYGKLSMRDLELLCDTVLRGPRKEGQD